MQSPVYWHPKLYEFVMRRLYGPFFETRYSNLQDLIPANANLLEICMGDMYFYHHYLSKKNISYRCADVNPIFVNAAKAKGFDAFILDFIKDEIPKSDHILMQGSLYHAIPNEAEVIKKLLNSANKQLIISECVKNVSNSGNGMVSAIAAFASKAKSGQSKIKFTKESLKAAFSGFEKNMVQWIEPQNSIETIIVLQK